jgi:hypothetical protein
VLDTRGDRTAAERHGQGGTAAERHGQGGTAEERAPEGYNAANRVSLTTGASPWAEATAASPTDASPPWGEQTTARGVVRGGHEHASADGCLGERGRAADRTAHGGNVRPIAEQRAAERPTAEQRAAERPTAEQRAAERRAAEQRAAERRAAEQRAAWRASALRTSGARPSGVPIPIRVPTWGEQTQLWYLVKTAPCATNNRTIVPLSAPRANNRPPAQGNVRRNGFHLGEIGIRISEVRNTGPRIKASIASRSTLDCI